MHLSAGVGVCSTRCLLGAGDGSRGDSVERVDDLQRAIEERAIGLRTVVTSLRMSADLERSGDLAAHVAKLARLRYPERAVPGDLHRTVLEIGQLAQRLRAQAAEILVTRDVEAALQMEQDDDRMDELHRMIFQHLLDDR